MSTHPTPVRRVPPSRDQLLQAMARLKPGRSELVAFHLALPVQAPAGIGLRREAGLWTWRGVSTAHRDPVEAACALAALGWEDSDRFLDLSSCPSCWVKPVRTGARIVVFGTDVLFDAPLLTVPSDLPSDVALLVAHAVIAGELSADGLVDAPGGPLRLVETAAGLTASRLTVTRS